MKGNSFSRQIEEIRKHLWIESQKAGRDLGLEWAAFDWVKKYAEDFRRGLEQKEKGITWLAQKN